MFLEGIERKQRRLEEKYAKTRSIVDEASMPGKNLPGTMINLRVSPCDRQRVAEMKDTHEISSARDTAYKAMLIGLDILESLPPKYELHDPAPAPRPVGRVLTDDDLAMIREEGFNCPREGRPERPYDEDGGERIKLDGVDDEDDEDD